MIVGILSGISIMSIYLISLEYLHQQLRKEKRKNAYEMQKLLASNQRLKMVKPCFLYDNISLLFFFWEGGGRGCGGVGEGKWVPSGNLFSYLWSFCAGLTTKDRRGICGHKTAKRADRISKGFVTQISWLGDLVLHSVLVCFPPL